MSSASIPIPTVMRSKPLVNKSLKIRVGIVFKRIVMITERITFFFRVTALVLCLLYMFLLGISFFTELGTTLYSIAQNDFYAPTVGEIVKADVAVNELAGKPNGVLTEWLLNPEHAILASRILWTVIAVLPLLLAYAFGSYFMGKLSLICMRFWEPTAGKKSKKVVKQKVPVVLINEIINPEWETVAREDKMR
jgi:hypothetical protein